MPFGLKMIEDFTQHLGVLTVSLHIPHAQSLKDKRMVLRSLRDRVRNKFNVSVSELEGQDKWQRATFGFAMINNDSRHVESSLQNLLSFLESFGGFDVCEHKIEFY